jgi:hypothetical protein
MTSEQLKHMNELYASKRFAHSRAVPLIPGDLP